MKRDLGNCEEQEGICVIPEPKQVKVIGEEFVIDQNTRIFVGHEAGAELSDVARILRQKLRTSIGVDVPIAKGILPPVEGVVILQVLGDMVAKEAFIAESAVDIRQIGDEGYYLRVGRNVIIAGMTPAGVFYGIQTLLQIVREGGVVPGVEIKDWPDLRMRGLMIDLRCETPKFWYMKEIVDKLSSYKINTLLIEYEDKIQYERHPLLSHRRSFTKKQIRELVGWAKRRHVDIVPLVQCLGFSEYILRHSRYAHLREKRQSIRQLCPSNPSSIELFRELASELVELHPETKYFHVGGDETRFIGQCDSCRRKVAEMGTLGLYIWYMRKVFKILANLGKTPIMWGDMLLYHRGMIGAKESLSDREAVDLAREKLPSDLVIMDWDYWSPLAVGPRSDEEVDNPNFPDVEVLKKAGFEVIAAPGIRTVHDGNDCIDYNLHIANVIGFAKKADDNNLLGLVNTCWPTTGTMNVEWLRAEEEVVGTSWDERRLPLETVWYGVVCGAEYTWNTEGATKKQFDRKFTEQFYGIPLPEVLEAIYLLSVTRFPDKHYFLHSASVYQANANKMMKPVREALTLLREAKRKAKRNRRNIDFTILGARMVLHKANRFSLFRQIEDNIAKRELGAKPLLASLEHLCRERTELEKDINLTYGEVLKAGEVKEMLDLWYKLEKEKHMKFKRLLRSRI